MAVVESDFRRTPPLVDARSPAVGDDQAEFEQVYRIYAPMVGRVVGRFVKDDSRAEDLIQETFLRAYRAWPKIDTDRPIWPWLRTIARRVCIDSWRSANSQSEVTCADLDFPEPSASAGDPADAVISRLRRTDIHKALATLRPRERRVLALRYLEELGYADIANIEGMTLAALKCSLTRARASFRSKYLSVVGDRALGVLVWPAAPIVQRLRTWARRSSETVGSTIQRLNTYVHTDSLLSAAQSHLSSGVVVLALVLGSLGPSATQPTTDGALDLVRTDIGHASSSAFDARGDDSRKATAPSRRGVTSHLSGSEIEEPAEENSTPSSLPADLTSDDSVPNKKRERASAQVKGVTEPNENVTTPEDAQITSFAASTAGDTIFAAGRNRECPGDEAACPAVLFRSVDGGGHWTQLEAHGFDGHTLLLPPAFGAGDDRIFAMSYVGVLQVSEDGGVTFGPAVKGAPSFNGSMDISPGFNSGDPRILIGTSSHLVQYNDYTKTISPAPYSSLPGSLEPAFATPSLLMVGGRKLNDQRQWRSAVFRCEETVCEGTRFGDEAQTPKLRLGPGFSESGLLYAFTAGALHASADGGISFSQLSTPSVKGYLVDLGVVDGGQKLFAAMHTQEATVAGGLYTSEDGASTWTKVESALFEGGASVIRVLSTRVLVALRQGGIACSPDMGVTWARRCQ